MPQQVLSKLDFVFHLGYINGSDVRSFGNSVVFHHLLQELKSLEEEGLEITTTLKKKRIYFTVGLILGDNLGLNSMLGFIKMNISLRNNENYSIDLSLDNFQETGVKENCIFNEL